MALTIDESNKNEIGMIIAGAAAVIAAFLPWVKVAFISVNGIEGDGQISAIAGVVLAAMGLDQLRASGGRRAGVIVGLVASVIIALLGLYHWNNLSDGVSSVQIGVYLTIVAGVGGAVMSGQALSSKQSSAEPVSAEPGAPAATPAPPAGWHPDPYGDTTIMRYWDGQTWTGHTARAQTEPDEQSP